MRKKKNYQMISKIYWNNWRRLKKKNRVSWKIQDKIEQYENCIWKWRETDKEFGGDDKVGEQ